MATAAKQDFDQLMNQFRVKLVGASDAGIKGELYDTFREFFNDSSSWLEDIPLSIVAGTLAYDLVPGDGGRVIRLAGVLDQNNIPQPALMPVIGQLLLQYAQNTSASWIATVVKNVSLPTTKDQMPIVPDWVLPVFGEAILSGVLGRMMMSKDKSYSDKEQGKYYLARFRKGITDARVATLTRNTIGAQAWAFPQSFRSRSQKGGVSVGNATKF